MASHTDLVFRKLQAHMKVEVMRDDGDIILEGLAHVANSLLTFTLQAFFVKS